MINRFKWALNAIMFLSCVSLNSRLGALEGSKGLWSWVCQRFPEPEDSLWAQASTRLYSCFTGEKNTQRLEKEKYTFVLSRFSPWNVAKLHQWEALYIWGRYDNPFASFFLAKLMSQMQKRVRLNSSNHILFIAKLDCCELAKKKHRVPITQQQALENEAKCIIPRF